MRKKQLLEQSNKYLDICTIIDKQIENIFNYKIDTKYIINDAIHELRKILINSKSKYCVNGLDDFSIYNTIQNCILLYLLSHISYKNGNNNNAEKYYYLNKIINGVDIFYAVELPKIWYCEHPLGTVIGRAKYGNNFFFYQGCTVGGNYDGKYPTIGDNVIMFSNSKIIGNSTIGNNVIISANTYIKNETIPNNSIVFGQSPNIVINRNRNKVEEIIKKFW